MTEKKLSKEMTLCTDYYRRRTHMMGQIKILFTHIMFTITTITYMRYLYDGNIRLSPGYTTVQVYMYMTKADNC